MSVCEKCWSDAYRESYCNPRKSQAECYAELIKERKDNPCTEAQQRGIEEELVFVPPVLA